MRFGISGYAVIEHGGDELSDWQHIKAVLPTKRAAITYARREIGTFSLTDALARQRALNEAPDNHLEPAPRPPMGKHARSVTGTRSAVSRQPAEPSRGLDHR
jgi:hypothetical protein